MQTILVIDDDESLRDTIGVMLEQEGFHAELAADGRGGYDRALTLQAGSAAGGPAAAGNERRRDLPPTARRADEDADHRAERARR